MSQIKILLFGLLCLLVGYGVDAIVFRPTTLIVGHRGDCAHYPENTMVSFEGGISAGCDLFETDLRLTKDEQIVLIHDAWVNRTTNGTGLVANMTLAEIQSLDAGSWFNKKFAGEKIPTLKDALDLIVNRQNLSLVMDLKVEGLGKYIAPLVKQLGVQDRVIASCWTDTQVQDIKQYLNITVKQKLTSTLPATITNKYFSDLLESGVHAFSVRYDLITPQFISSAHQHAMPVNAWTVDDTTNATRMINYGIDGIISDDVEMLVKLLRSSETTDASSGGDHHPVLGHDGVKKGAVAGIAVGTLLVGMIIGGSVVMLYIRKRGRHLMYEPIASEKGHQAH